MNKVIIIFLLFLVAAGGVFVLRGDNQPELDSPQMLYTEILLVVVNNYQPDTLLTLQERLQESFQGVTVKVHESTIILPDEFFEEDRQQYNSRDVLSFINQSLPNRPSTQIVVGVIEDEIYTDKLNFAFSSADRINKVAVISTAYFGREIEIPTNRDSNFDMSIHAENVITDRSHKAALRMTGGIVGLRSNVFERDDCAMSFSNTLSELDKKGTNWCGDNLELLKIAGLLD